MGQTILLVDDDKITHTIVKGALSTDLNLISAFTLKEAEDIIAKGTTPALIIIDRILPDGDGLNLCSNVRNHDRLKDTPIIFLSSKGTETDKVGGLFAGADDYISKPVSPLELKARIQARLRHFNKRITIGLLTIDLEAHRVFLNTNGGQSEIDLTRIEFKILVTLTQSLDRVYSREQMLSNVWGANCNVTDRVVDTHLSHLRKKLSGSGLNIQSIRGEGYRISLSALPSSQAA